MPLTEDLGKAYANYYTHSVPDVTPRTGLLKQIDRMIKRGYKASRYGTQESILAKALGRLLYLFPIRRSEADADMRFLRVISQGRLLDVGCGSGNWLLSMQKLGWQVRGVDFDENAVSAATQRGLNVRCGNLEEQEFQSASFDAITLNHVIEHLPDPLRTLTECARLLKPGGKLVLFTPNAASLGHHVFGQDWRGLEPPRHLHIFSMKSVSRLLYHAGFNKVMIRPFIVTSVIYESILLRQCRADSPMQFGRSRRIRFVTELFKLLELSLLKLKPSVADCMSVVAVKE